MASQIQVRRDSAANWTTTNPVLAQGEPGYETDTGKLKYGDGTSTWSALPYSAAPDNFDLDAVTTNGNTTTNSITVGAATLTGDLAVDTDTLFVDVSADRVGINKSNPSEALEINGNLKFSDGAARTIEGSLNQNLIINSLGNLTGEGVDLRVNGTSVLLADFTGNVGVGTVAPTFKLTVEDEAAILSSSSGGSSTLVIGSGQNSQDSIQSVQFRDRFGTSGFPDGQVGAYVQMERQGTNARYDLTFGTVSSSTVDAAERMRITDTGNVGLGTSNPTKELEIQLSSNTGTTLGQKGGLQFYSASSTAGNGGEITWQSGTGNTERWCAISGHIVENGVGGSRGDLVLATKTAITDTALTERMRINSSGNVGIGTTSPASLVSGGSSPILSIGGTDTALTTGEKAGSLSFITNDPSYTATYSDGITGEIVSVAETGVGGGYGLAFYTGVTTDTDRAERVRIDMRGNVGIGTDAPATILHLAEDNPLMRFEDTAGGTPYTFDVGSDAGLFKVINTTDATTPFVIEGSTGDVGIGTTTPNRHLDIEDTTSNPFISLVGSTTSVPGLLFGDTGSDAVGQIRYDNTDNSMAFTTSNTEKLVITAGGNVGIGTNSPSDLLDISANGTSAMRLSDSSSPATYAQFSQANGVLTLSADAGNSQTGSNMQFEVDGSEAMRITDSGNVGIGIAPTEKLHVHGDALIGDASPDANLYLFKRFNGTGALKFQRNTAGLPIDASIACDANENLNINWNVASDITNQALFFNSNGSEVARMNASGRFSLGAGDPTYKLEWDGTARFTNNNYIRQIDSAGASPRILGMNSSNDTYVGPVDSYAGGSVLYGASGNVDSQFMYRLGQIAYSINTSGNHIWYKPGGVQGMIMLNDGNVMINKTVKQTQTQGLDVEQITATDADGALGLKSGTSTTTGNVFVNCFLQNGVGSGRIEANGANALGFGTFSDRSLKENIEDLPPQLASVMQLRPVEFDYKDGSGHQVGFIAQEVEAVWPDLVSGEEGSKSVVGLGKTESRLIKALQEAVTKIEALEARIAVLESN